MRLGHVVLCAGYRNPALTTKMICTLDAISGGRVELGLGAGWKRDEWRAYGYGFPDAPERLAILKDQLEIARAMMTEDRATYDGTPAQRSRRDQSAAAGPAAAHPDHGRRQRAQRDLAARRALCR